MRWLPNSLLRTTHPFGHDKRQPPFPIPATFNLSLICSMKTKHLAAAIASLLICQSAIAQWATKVSISQGRWLINGQPTNPNSAAEGLLMNVRMVNATFEDASGQKPEFDATANAEQFIANINDHAAHGVNAFTLCLQGGMPGYEGAVNSAFAADGSLRAEYINRVERVIRACDKQGIVVILGCYYQRQSKLLRDEAAIRSGLVNVAKWIQSCGFQNVVLEVANEYPHDGFVHRVIRDPVGQASLIRLVKETAPDLLVTASGYGDGRIHAEVAEAADFLTPHWNGTNVGDIPTRVDDLRKYGKPIVCNEDDRVGEQAVAALHATVTSGAGYGLMLKDHNQTYPFHFDGAADDEIFYAALRSITTGKADERAPESPVSGTIEIPPPESQGGWRIARTSEEIEAIAEMDASKIEQLREWLLNSDDRPFAAVVIRHGTIALQVERGNSAVSDTQNIKSCAKAICATVLAIAAEQSQQGQTPNKMSFDDKAFDLLPWAHPLSDPRKAQSTVKQLLNHTSGITPESTGVSNRGPWDLILGHAGDERNQRLAFDPGSDLDYGTHAFYHASLVCEHVTGKPYDQFAVENLLKPIGAETWWFEFIDGDAAHGRHPSHAIGLPARDLARIGYCMLHNGRWGQRQIIPEWFVRETAAPTHTVTGIKTFGRDARSFSHGWELPGLLSGDQGHGIPRDARFKPGSGGQMIAFVPSLDLVVARQTGGSGQWAYEEFLRRACDAVLP
jgi:CubicO group peptidase (beta-lactamase class C family)